MGILHDSQPPFRELADFKLFATQLEVCFYVATTLVVWHNSALAVLVGT